MQVPRCFGQGRSKAWRRRGEGTAQAFLPLTRGFCSADSSEPHAARRPETHGFTQHTCDLRSLARLPAAGELGRGTAPSPHSNLAFVSFFCPRHCLDVLFVSRTNACVALISVCAFGKRLSHLKCCNWWLKTLKAAAKHVKVRASELLRWVCGGTRIWCGAKLFCAATCRCQSPIPAALSGPALNPAVQRGRARPAARFKGGVWAQEGKKAIPNLKKKKS